MDEQLRQAERASAVWDEPGAGSRLLALRTKRAPPDGATFLAHVREFALDLVQAGSHLDAPLLMGRLAVPSGFRDIPWRCFKRIAQAVILELADAGLVVATYDGWHAPGDFELPSRPRARFMRQCLQKGAHRGHSVAECAERVARGLQALVALAERRRARAREKFEALVERRRGRRRRRRSEGS